ncbi:MAG: SURF1 family protein [Colwellia sp.]
MQQSEKTALSLKVALKNQIEKINLLWFIITVLVFSGLVKLGFWQSARALEKEQRLIRIEAFNQQAPLSLKQLSLLDDSENINDFPVIIEGTFNKFNKEAVFLLDNQVNGGQLGYRVLQVVNSGENAVLVNLGWVQGSINRQELPDISPLQGLHSFRGNVRLVEVGIVLMEQNFDNAKWPLRVQNIELDKFSTLLHQTLLPFIVYVDVNERLGFKKNWQPIVMPPEKHRAYAFQWFSLAFAWLVLMIWAAIKSAKSSNNTYNEKEAR